MSFKLPTLHDGEIMYHAETRTIGQVVGTIYPPDNKLENFEQVLRLKDGTQQKFRLVELHPATSVAIEQFWEDAKIPRMNRLYPG
jgi:hypothetical protein